MLSKIPRLSLYEPPGGKARQEKIRIHVSFLERFGVSIDKIVFDQEYYRHRVSKKKGQTNFKTKWLLFLIQSIPGLKEKVSVLVRTPNQATALITKDNQFIIAWAGEKRKRKARYYIANNSQYDLFVLIHNLYLKRGLKAFEPLSRLTPQKRPAGNKKRSVR